MFWQCFTTHQVRVLLQLLAAFACELLQQFGIDLEVHCQVVTAVASHSASCSLVHVEHLVALVHRVLLPQAAENRVGHLPKPRSGDCGLLIAIADADAAVYVRCRYDWEDFGLVQVLTRVHSKQRRGLSLRLRLGLYRTRSYTRGHSSCREVDLQTELHDRSQDALDLTEMELYLRGLTHEERLCALFIHILFLFNTLTRRLQFINILSLVRTFDEIRHVADRRRRCERGRGRLCHIYHN